MITLKNILILLLLCIIALTGCFSSTRIYKKEFIKNDSTFMQRDEGAEILIGLNNDEEHTGELLNVSDSTIILSNKYGLSEEVLLSSFSNITVIQNQDIKSIWVLGEDNHLIGLAIGVGLGLAIIKIAGNQPKRNDALLIGSIGLLTAVSGMIAGAATSTYDEEIYHYKNAEDFEFMQLNIYSRYGGSEPEYLEKIK